MNKELMQIICCPSTKKKLILKDEVIENTLVKSGILMTEDGTHTYKIIDFIPRFVPEKNYADNFGFQWNKFRNTQLDSYSKTSISHDRFWNSTGWSKSDLKDKWILDCGCGAGRFAEIALQAGANVVALDYSSAVDACYLNLGSSSKLHVVQGDIYQLPFEFNSFDYVYSLGVLQHTPNVKDAFMAVFKQVKIGGFFCVDFYEKNFKSKLLPKFWLRPITKRIKKEKLFSFLEATTPFLFNLSQTLNKIPIIGVYLKRLVPVANYSGILPLNNSQLKEWALLDTFDWLSPEYDNPQNKSTLLKWSIEANLDDIEILKVVHLVARGKNK
jgi:2-polyprenyl-3-methyl-5-hydroxy-6-metoxy-1,4-benzoquinol methylase